MFTVLNWHNEHSHDIKDGHQLQVDGKFEKKVLGSAISESRKPLEVCNGSTDHKVFQSTRTIDDD